MKNLLLSVLCGCLLGSPLMAASVPRGTEVLVTSDAIPSPEGFRPKPGKPILYVLNQTRQSLGEAVAGVKLPPPEVIEKAIVAELAKQGFVKAEVGGPMPGIVILAVVGDSNFSEPPFDVRRPLEDPDFSRYLYMVNVQQVIQRNMLSYNGMPPRVSVEDVFAENAPRNMDTEAIREAVIKEALRLRARESGRSRDRGTILNLVGADKVERAVSERKMSAVDAEQFVWATMEDRYYIALNAFDAERWQKKERVLLWRTVMMIDYRKDFAKSLEAMLAQAGPMFGTDLAVPAILDERDRREADVSIGEMKVVTEKESAPKPEAKK